MYPSRLDLLNLPLTFRKLSQINSSVRSQTPFAAVGSLSLLPAQLSSSCFRSSRDVAPDTFRSKLVSAFAPLVPFTSSPTALFSVSVPPHVPQYADVYKFYVIKRRTDDFKASPSRVELASVAVDGSFSPRDLRRAVQGPLDHASLRTSLARASPRRTNAVLVLSELETLDQGSNHGLGPRNTFVIFSTPSCRDRRSTRWKRGASRGYRRNVGQPTIRESENHLPTGQRVRRARRESQRRHWPPDAIRPRQSIAPGCDPRMVSGDFRIPRCSGRGAQACRACSRERFLARCQRYAEVSNDLRSGCSSKNRANMESAQNVWTFCRVTGFPSMKRDRSKRPSNVQESTMSLREGNGKPYSASHGGIPPKHGKNRRLGF